MWCILTFPEADLKRKGSLNAPNLSLSPTWRLFSQSFSLWPVISPPVMLINVILKMPECSGERHLPNLITAVWDKWRNRWGVIHSSPPWRKCSSRSFSAANSFILDATGAEESSWRPGDEAWWSSSGWLRLPALFISGRVEVEESSDLLVCYQLTTIGHLLPASLPPSLALLPPSLSLSFAFSVCRYLSPLISIPL